MPEENKNEVQPTALIEEQIHAVRIIENSKWIIFLPHLLAFISLVISAITLMVLINTVDVAKEQAKIMQGQLDEMKSSSTDVKNQAKIMQGQLDEMRAEQRPNLWFGNDVGSPKFILADPEHGTGQITWNVHLTNFGKNFVAGGSQKNYMKLDGGKDELSFGNPSESVSIAPIAPLQDYFITIISRPGITPMEFDRLLKKSEGITVRIVSDYTDFSGNHYHAWMCLARLNSGAISFCKTGNAVD